MPRYDSPRLPDPQPTLGELRAGGVTVYLRCQPCQHPHWLKPEDLRGDNSRTLDDIAERVRCSLCGSGNDVEVSVIPEQWVRYLRATGQRDRLPEYAERWFPEE